MTTGILIAGGIFFLIVILFLIVYVPAWDWTSEATQAAGSALETVSFGRDGDLIDGQPAIDGAPEVNTHQDGEPIVVPIVEVELDTDGEPDRVAAYRIAAGLVQTVHPEYADTHVRNYDIHLVYGDSSWVSQPDSCRIAITPELVERLSREPDFDADDLRRAVEDRDDGDDEIPPVAWGEPLDYRHEETSAVSTSATAGI